MTEAIGDAGRLRRLIGGGIGRILAGSAIGQGILVAVSPLLTRIYSPADFGALAVFTGVATVFGGLATMSWERAIVIPRRYGDALALAVLAAASAVAFSLLIAPVCFLLRNYLDQLFGTSFFADLWWLVPVSALVLGLQATVSAWLVRGRRYKAMAARNGVQGVLQAGSSVLLGVLGLTPFGLLSGMAIGRFSSILGVVKWRRLFRASLPNHAALRATAKRFKRFPQVATWSRTLNSLGLQLPPILIVALYGPVQAGLFALTLRVMATPVGIVVDAVSQYFESVFAERCRERTPTLVRLIRQVCGGLFVVSVIPSIAVVAFAPQVFAIVFGEEWRAAGVYAQITIPAYALQFAVSPISRSLLVVERQGLQFGWDLARASATVLAVFLPFSLGGTLIDALVALTVTQFLLYGVLLVLCLGAAHRKQLEWHSSA